MIKNRIKWREIIFISSNISAKFEITDKLYKIQSSSFLLMKGMSVTLRQYFSTGVPQELTRSSAKKQ